jgi:5S rRNA maturation endonuclease (ribonuclease M5)
MHRLICRTIENGSHFAELITKLSPKAIIILDDVNRPGERALAEAFAKALATHELTIYEHEKGTAVISPR